MNARAGSNARELRKVEMSPVRAGRILPMMRMMVQAVIPRVTVRSLRCIGRHVVRILMHAVIEHHALVKASFRRMVSIPIVVWRWVSMILLVVGHIPMRRMLIIHVMGRRVSHRKIQSYELG